MLDIEVKGITSAIDSMLIYISSLCRSCLLIIGDSKIIKIIIIILIIITTGNIENINFLLFLVSSPINLDKARGKPNWLKLISSVKVGRISMYNPNPLVPISLAITIFISMPNIFVNRPPISKIIVDFINLFFILNFIKKNYTL